MHFCCYDAHAAAYLPRYLFYSIPPPRALRCGAARCRDSVLPACDCRALLPPRATLLRVRVAGAMPAFSSLLEYIAAGIRDYVACLPAARCAVPPRAAALFRARWCRDA